VVYGVAIVALLPDKEQALKELIRVVIPSGTIGTLNLFARRDASQDALNSFKDTMSTLLGLGVSILDIQRWKDLFDRTGLNDIDLKEIYKDVLVTTRGRAGAAKATLKMIYHMLINGPVRKRMMKLMRLRKTAVLTSDKGFENVGYLVFTGRK
jgi:ubiquinone/menaquinone biosynthesis C-methylase UbiE